MQKLIDYLERKIEGCDALGGMEKEKAVYQSVLKETRKQLQLHVVMPRRLTAENGAKYLMSGEFFEEIEITNEEYCGCGECDYCYDFAEEDEQPTILKKIPVSWDNIKSIYKKAVDIYGA
jgi:hypothetical protein